jgi:peptidoglycan/xylan/chitin deacetylase (PgdA/CDA1 family)
MKFDETWQLADRSSKLIPTAAMGLAVLFVVALGSASSLATPATVSSPIAVASPIPLPSPAVSPINTARSGNNLATTIPGDKRIPILMYHYIRDYHDPKDKVGTNLSVSPTIFAAQLQTIKEAGFTTINFNDLTDPLTLPEKPIIISFDDGYEDAYSAALPALQRQGMNGVFYLVNHFLNTDKYLTNDQVKALNAAGMEIGSHTLDHKDLAKMTLALQRQQLADSKTGLEQLIGKPVRDFCYPSGKYTDETLSLAKEVGYRTATTTKDGIASGARLAGKPYELPRLRITEGTDLLRELREIQ